MLIGIDASRAFSPQRTGTENYSYNLIKALTRVDKTNTYRLYTRNVSKDNFHLIDFPLPGNFSIKNISWSKFWTQGGLALETILHPPDVLFIPAHTLPLMREFSLSNTKTVVTIHDLGYEYLPNYHSKISKIFLNRSTEWAVKWANALIAVSEATRQNLIEKMQCDRDKVSVIYEGVDLEKFKMQNVNFQMKDETLNNIGYKKQTERLASKYGVKGDYILFVGTIQPRKNLLRLIEAFSLVYKRLSNQHLQLIIVGKSGWMNKAIYQAPSKYGVNSFVHFINYIPDIDLPLFYTHARLLCLPSLFEGFGLPILEAMALGCPVVTSNVSSLPEVTGDSAVLVDPLSIISISFGIEQILTNDKQRSLLIQKGKERVKHFTWEKTANETVSLFKKLISK